MPLPIFDLHCDLLSYLAKFDDTDPFDPKEIACAVPHLLKGNVKAQVTAIYTDVRADSMNLGLKQANLFAKLIENYPETFYAYEPGTAFQNEGIGIFAAIENAAGLGTENATWSEIYHQFDCIVEKVGTLAYVSLTHHTENRFGGGNYTEGVGLKEDGKKLLDHLSGKKIPIDLSHTSDLLAEGILNHINAQKLDIPVIASHSNYRTIWNHKRNLSDEFAQEILQRKGIIGVNFLRAFLDNDVPERLFEHILHGFELGGENAQCFGADFFYTKDFPDKSRHPFYFPLAENASKYPSILSSLSEQLTPSHLERVAWKNPFEFYKNLHS